MFTSEYDYLIAWSAYGIAALGCLLVWFRMTRPLWRWLREPLRLLVAVLLLTPTLVDAERDLYAPAVAISALDLAFEVGNNVWNAVADLATFGVVAFGLYLVLVVVRWLVGRQRGASAAEDPRPLRERLDEETPEQDYPSLDGRRTRTEPRL